MIDFNALTDAEMIEYMVRDGLSRKYFIEPRIEAEGPAFLAAQRVAYAAGQERDAARLAHIAGVQAHRAAKAEPAPAAAPKSAKPAPKRAPSRARREADREMMEDMGWYD